jgi:hypothetical protein
LYTDNYIDLHYPSGPSNDGGIWTVDDGLDIGHIYHHYKADTGDEHGALIWHNASDELRWYMGGVEYVTTTTLWDVSTATFGVFRTGSILLQNTTSATSTSTGTLVVAGGVGVGGDLRVGGTIYGTIVGGISTATNLAGGTAGQLLYQTAPGVTSFVSTGTAGNVLVSNGSGAPTYNNTLTLTGTTAASSTTTGALQVAGGVGIGGLLWLGQNTTSGIRTTNGFIYDDGNLHIHGLTGALWLNSTAVGGDIRLNNQYNGNVILTNGVGNVQILSTQTASSTATGALRVVGGVGIGGALYAGSIYDDGNRVVTNVAPSGSTYIGISNLISTGTSTSFTINNLGVTSLTGTTYLSVSTSTGNVTLTNLGVQTLTAGTDTAVSSSTGTVTVWNTSTLQTVTGRGASTNNAVSITNATSATSTLTGALIVTGGVGIGNNLYVGGIIYGTVSGNITTATNLAGGTAGQVPYQTAPGVTSFVSTGTAGNVLVSNGTSAPSYNNTLTLAGTTTSISTTTGALQVVGGIGIGGSVYVGNRVGFVNTAGNASVVYQFYNTVTNSLDTVFG